MIRAFLAAIGAAVAALALLLIACGLVSVPGMAAGLHPDCNVTMPCISPVSAKVARGKQLERAMPFGAAIVPPETQRSFLSGAPRYISGRLKCAVNVNAALAARGLRGTGSALAKSFLSWGRASGPTPGAVAVFSRGRRGGHVAIVQELRPDGTVIYLNPSSRRQAWHVGPYSKRPIAFRVAG